MDEHSTIEEREDRAYTRGYEQAYLAMLQQCLLRLGINDPVAQHAQWIEERAAVVTALRALCEQFGDNDWPDTLHLGDVIEKHLTRHLLNS